MAQNLNDSSWIALLRRTADGRSTPFIGAGVSPHPKAGEIARAWADGDRYPLTDCDDLARVAQFLAIKVDRAEPRQRILEVFRKTAAPDFSDVHEPHRVLADLGLPLYITTNYDPFMVDALVALGRSPKRLICNWNGSAADWNAQQMGARSVKKWERPTSDVPWVFHLHGADVVEESIVITEDDYLDFLAGLKSDTTTMLPFQVLKALSSTSLLFAGYSLADWTFRVLFRSIQLSLPQSARISHFALQLPRHEGEQEYLARYFEDMDVQVFWGDKDEFFLELRNRWDAYSAAA